MNTTATRHLIACLHEMPAFLERAVAGLPPDVLVAQPAVDTSPFLEHVWHLRDCEADLYGMRIRRVLHEHEPYLEPMSVDHWPLERRYLHRPVLQALQEFRSLRDGLVAELAQLPAAALDRRGRRVDGRTSTVVDLVAEVLAHDQDHRQRLAAMLAALQAGAA